MSRSQMATVVTTKLLAIVLAASALMVGPAHAAGQRGAGVRARSRSAASVQQAAQPTVDGWRYKWHNGHWWYYQPNKQWLFWNGTTWSEYSRSTYQEFLWWRAYVARYGVPTFDLSPQKGPGFSDSGEVYQNRD